MDTNFSQTLKDLLLSGRNEAARHNSRHIKPEHLLLALMTNPASTPF